MKSQGSINKLLYITTIPIKRILLPFHYQWPPSTAPSSLPSWLPFQHYWLLLLLLKLNLSLIILSTAPGMSVVPSVPLFSPMTLFLATHSPVSIHYLKFCFFFGRCLNLFSSNENIFFFNTKTTWIYKNKLLHNHQANSLYS